MTITTVSYAIAALFVVLSLIVLVGRAARATRFVKRATSARLRVEESIAIDARRRLLLVRCDGREVLLLTGSPDLVVGWLADHQPDGIIS